MDSKTPDVFHDVQSEDGDLDHKEDDEYEGLTMKKIHDKKWKSLEMSVLRKN